jgi:hypothetical protein
MNKVYALGFAVFLCLTFSAVGSAQTRTPGVQPGDYFTYNIFATWSSSNPNATVPSAFNEFNNTAWYKVSITAVIDSNVTSTDIWHFKNGTEIPKLVVQDIESGTMYYMNGFGGIVGADLNVGDLLHPSGTDNLIVNETVSRSYAGGRRDTNIVDVTYPLMDSSNNTIGSERVTYYLDKSVGVLVEMHDEIQYVNPEEKGAITWTLKETNRWVVSAHELSLPLPLPILLVIIAAIIAVIAFAFFFKHRRTRKKRR